jgi:uncharacterized protein YggU (UPF0235/DUF167 family)
LAAAFGLRPRDFTIVHGELARDKRLLIRDATPSTEELYAVLKSGFTLL